MEGDENNGETTGFSETHQACPNLELTGGQPNARLHTPASLLADHHQSPSGQTDKRDNFGSDDTAAAVTALIQMQGSGLNGYTPTDTSRISKENQAINWAPDMTNFYYHVQSRADTEGSQQVLTQTNRTYPLCNANSSTSGISVHDTISNLSSTISSMRQQQAVMASALGNLTNVIQDMRSGSQTQGASTHSAAHEAVGNFSLAGSSSMSQAQPSSTAGYQSYQARYETNEYRASEQQGLQDNIMSGCRLDDSGEQHHSQRNNEVQQCGHTDTRTLPYPTRERPVGHNETQYLHRSYSLDETSQEGWAENSSLSNPRREGQYRRQPQGLSHYNNSVFPAFKLPPFNGKEDWKVWLNRFEAVATRRKWSDDDKLDNLLPRLQGRAGDFVYTQLSQETMSSYPELIKELNNRFRVVETQKTFAAKLSQRTQKPGETVEEYAAELKRLYSKAYKTRDSSTRQEDLVRRFLDGLKDSDASFEIEFHKEPDDIDEAVFHAVNFIQTKRRSQTDSYQDRKFKRYARRTSTENDGYKSEDGQTVDEEVEDEAERIMRLPSKDEQSTRTNQKSEQKKANSVPESDSLTEVKQMLKTLAGKVEEIQKGSTVPSNQKPLKSTNDYSGVICYGCGERGHISRRCPQKQGAQRPRENTNHPTPSQGRVESRNKKSNPLNC